MKTDLSINDNQPTMALFPIMQVPFISTICQSSIQAADTALYHTRLIHVKNSLNFADRVWYSVESLQVDWLIQHFNHWFVDVNTQLVRGTNEPEYFAKTVDEPAKIVFAHGFFASALHEISHWCVAGKKRRLLNDFGYWYAPDGRTQQQQQAFEQVEIVPQAIECLLTLMCGKKFQVSQDNLFADFDTKQSTFKADVCHQAIKFWQTGEKLPSDAKILLQHLQPIRQRPLTTYDILANFYSI